MESLSSHSSSGRVAQYDENARTSSDEEEIENQEPVLKKRRGTAKNYTFVNYLAYYKTKLFGEFIISLGDLKTYADNNSSVPENDDQVFVADHNLSFDDNTKTVLLSRQSFFQMHRLQFHLVLLKFLGKTTNSNELEASNRIIKAEQTFRERLPIGRLIHVIENEMVHEWSIKRDPSTVNNKVWATEVEIDLKDFTDSHQWLLLKKDIVSKTMLGRKFYFTPASDRTDLTKAEVNDHVDSRMSRCWPTFDEYVLQENSIWCVDINTQNWKASQCNCPKFYKIYKCKHVIGIASRLKLCEIPMQAKTIELGNKRKRGPALAKPALIRQ